MTDIKTYNARQLPKAIKALHSSGQTVQAEAHKIACSVLLHLGRTGDIRYTMAFLDAMPEMSRVNSIKAWLEKFGPIRFATPEETKVGAQPATFVKGKPTLLGDAMDNPFWKFKANEGTAYKAIDINKYVDQVLNRLKRDEQHAGADHSALIAAINKVHTTPVEPKH